MLKQSQVRPDEDAITDNQRASNLANAICASVMKVLGRPQNLFRISAVRLWPNHYRVNVLTGSDVVTVVVAQSYFVKADEKGNIVESVPALERRY